MSLDGVVQAPGGREEDTDGGFKHGGWSMQFFDPDTMGAKFDQMIATTDALLYGRRTWQGMAAAWPSRAGDAFADWINAVPKHVVTDTLAEEDLTWAPTSIIRGAEMPERVAAFREAAGKDMVIMGSAQLVRSLLEADVVDELRLMIQPIVLGGGKRIFPGGGEAHKFNLISAETTGTGVQMCTYRRSR